MAGYSWNILGCKSRTSFLRTGRSASINGRGQYVLTEGRGEVEIKCGKTRGISILGKARPSTSAGRDACSELASLSYIANVNSNDRTRYHVVITESKGRRYRDDDWCVSDCSRDANWLVQFDSNLGSGDMLIQLSCFSIEMTRTI